MTVQIISGRAARRRLQTPPGQRTRPTQSRVREALFSMITSRIGPLSGLRVLDGFSGSGALGLEAWSRGASQVWLLEAHPPTAKLIQANAQTIGAAPECRVICGRLPNALSSIPPDTTFDLILLDPPYGDPTLEPTLHALLAGARLHPQSLIVIEHSASQPPRLPPGLTLDLQRSYGDSAVSVLSLTASSAPTSPLFGAFMVRIAARLRRVEPSATLAITARAAALKAQGIDVIGFGAGEPDFNTPAPIIEAAKRALDQGLTKYSPVSGLASLRAAIAEDYSRRYGVPTKPAEVMVGCGGKHVLYNIAAAFCEAGDKILIPTPYWVSYPAQALLVDAEPVFLETTEADNFLVTPTSLDAALTLHKPRLLILNSPSNPTGTAYNREQLLALLDVLRKHPDTMLVWDAIYERLTYDGFVHHEPTVLAPDLRDRTFIVNGFSKTFSMTGWRLGYVIAPVPFIEAMDNFQSHTTSGATTFAQAAAVEALKLPQSAIDEMVNTFDGRRRRMLELLSEIPNVTCPSPQGAFYAFPNFSHYIGMQFNGKVIADDLALTAFLLEEGRVALVPGSAFGAPGFMRLSYATGMKAIEEGLRRTAEALKKLSR